MSDIPNDVMAEISSILPYDFVKQNNIFGIDKNGEIKIYSTSELSFDIHQELLRYIGKSFEVEICNAEELNKLITSNFSVISQNSELSEELKDNFDLKTFAGTITATEDLLSGSNDAPIIKLINGILSQAIKLRASDIHFEPYEDSLSVRYRIDGILQEVLSQDPRLTPLIIARLKVISKLDISERRLPQDGRVSLSLGDKNVDVRVSTLPSTYGERIVLRLLDKQSAQININDLGLPQTILSTYKKSLSESEGIILVTGPTGSGKTTTLYAGLRDLSDSSQNILTVEDPIEYTLKGIGQTQVNQKTGYSFATGLRAMLRQDPDVVMVGEIRDTETAQIAIQASLTGHLVLSTVHTNSAVGAITRLRDMGIESFLISSSLKTVISQRLVRRLCDSCKVKTTINKDIADLFGLKHNLEVYDHKGCDKCNGTGYKGRIAVAECVNVDKTIKDMIHNEKSENEINEYVFKNAPSINSSCSDLLIKGITSCDELIRSNNIKEDAFV